MVSTRLISFTLTITKLVRMTQKINFRLRLVRKPRPKTGPGLWEQLEMDVKAIPYDKSKFSLDEMKKAFAALYTQKQPAQRQVKLVTNLAGLDLFNKALQQEIKKQKHDRKRLSIKSKIFK